MDTQTAPQTAPEPQAAEQGVSRGQGADQTAPAPETASQTAPSRWEALAASLTPPDIISQPRPPLSDLLRYARHGRYVRDDGLARNLGRAWSWAAVGVVGACYSVAWTAERPSRFGAVMLLVLVLGQTPVLSWLLPWWLNIDGIALRVSPEEGE